MMMPMTMMMLPRISGLNKNHHSRGSDR